MINDRVIYPENRCNLSCYDDNDDGMQTIKKLDPAQKHFICFLSKPEQEDDIMY